LHSELALLEIALEATDFSFGLGAAEIGDSALGGFGGTEDRHALACGLTQ
jgi:hypothetical protein